MKKNMISIVIPVYEAEKTLERCLDSIFDQTYQNYEIILIDDGSFDNSACICDCICMEHAEITVIHKKNAGPSSARNIGMEQLDGEYFVCVDSDDIVKPSYLADFMDLKTRHPEFGHVWCGFERDSENGRLYLYSDEEESFKDRADYQELSDKILAQSPCFHLFRTDLVRRNHIRMQEDLSLGEDIVFNLEYLDAEENTSIGIINKPNYVYLDTDTSSLNNKYRPNLVEIYEYLDSKIGMYIDKWDILDKTGYYNSVLNHYFQVFLNTFHEENHCSLTEKIRFNSQVMRHERFRMALRETTCYINPILKIAYMSRNYWVVFLTQKIAQLKNRSKK